MQLLSTAQATRQRVTYAVQLRMPLGFRDVVLVGQLVQAAKRRRGGETMVQVGLPHMRLQFKGSGSKGHQPFRSQCSIASWLSGWKAA